MKPIVLVHGAWHGAWCWEPLLTHLSSAGAKVHTLDLPFTGPDGDAAAVRELLDDVGGDAVLVGHSYGGIVISKAAADRDDVDHLVYLCAIMLADGTDFGAMLATAPPVPLNSAIRFGEDGRSTIDPAHAVAAFYAECPPEVAAVAVERLRPFDLTSINGGGGPIAIAEPWRTIPATYVVCRQDGAIPADLQRSMAGNAATVVELDTDHSPFASRPAELAALLLGLAAD
jgi:pimeloyl-ACP methyl ester carboxylesterase